MEDDKTWQNQIDEDNVNSRTACNAGKTGSVMVLAFLHTCQHTYKNYRLSKYFAISSKKILFFTDWFVIIMNLVDETGSEKPKSTNCKPGGKKNEKEKIINCIGSSNTCIIHGWMWLFRRKRLWWLRKHQQRSKQG